MSDEAALLNAIAAHPDEDTPRLMYADWLEEHGNRTRAEFIRVQIEVSRIEQLPRIELNQYVGLFQRNQDLLDNHGAELLGPAASLWGIDARLEFHRGLLASVELRGDQFVSHADALATLNPLPDIILRDVAPALDALADVSPHLALVTAVHMQSNRRAYPTVLTPDEVWSIFVECWPWDRLKELNLEECRIGDQGMSSLLQSENLGGLVCLDVSANDLTDTAVDSLLNSKFPQQFTRLILGGNDITDVGAVALANRWPTGADDRLETLNLRFAPIGQAGQSALLRRFGGRLVLF